MPETTVEASYVENNLTMFQTETAARSYLRLFAAGKRPQSSTLAGVEGTDFDSLVDVWAEGLPTSRSTRRSCSAGSRMNMANST